MKKILLLLLFTMILDGITITDLRNFLIQFIMVKRNQKAAKKIYKEQSVKNKFFLSFIRDLLTQNKSAFNFFHKLYLLTLLIVCVEIPICGLFYIFLLEWSFPAWCIFNGFKAFVCIIVRLNVDSNRKSLYRK